MIIIIFDIPPEHKRISSSEKFIKKPTANFKHNNLNSTVYDTI